MRALAWGRVLRLSLAPSALADVAAGLLVGGNGAFPELAKVWPLFAASACVYHGGMALNDWADREHDAATRPERPIPSGSLSPIVVRAAGFSLFALALVFGALVSWQAAAWVAGIIALVLAYDFGSRGAWLGPLLLGACRAANLSLGLVCATTLAPHDVEAALPSGLVLPALYGAYVFAASRIARLEDAPEVATGAVGARYAAWATALLLVAPAMVDVNDDEAFAWRPLALAVALAGAWSLARMAATTSRWPAADCGRFTGMALRRLLVFTAVCALAHRGSRIDGVVVGGLILAGFPLSAALRRVFPPT